jgi:hypothetical protein
MASLGLGGLLLAALLPVRGMSLWPVATLLVGVLCGAAVFLPEQLGPSYRFLGDQRLPLGRVWLVKTVSWLAVAVLVAVLILLGAVLHLALAGSREALHGGRLQDWAAWLVGDEVLSPLVSSWLFLPVWLLYGFAAGLLLTQVFRKSIVAVLLALGVSAGLASAWMPSLLLGGLHFWQVLGVPVVLVAASRLVMRPWAADRLYSRLPLLGLVGCGLLALTWTAGGLAYRVAEVPDVGEPFDVPAFVASLPTPKENKAAQRLLQAASDLQEQRRQVDAKLPPPTKPLFPREKAAPGDAEAAAPGMGGAGGSGLTGQADGQGSYRQQVNDVILLGWPDGQHELGRWLDLLFEGDWAKDYRAAAAGPLGMMVDPRRVSFDTRLDAVQATREGVSFFVARALQLQARGEDARALDHLLVGLGVSRQLRSKAPTMVCLAGMAEESLVLTGFNHWLQRLGPRENLLRRAVRELTRHEEQTPPPSDWVKVGYFELRNDLPQLPRLLMPRQKGNLQQKGGALEDALMRLSLETPWERERALRLVNAVIAGQLDLLERPADWLEPPQQVFGRGRAGLLAFEVGAKGDLGGLSPRAWGELLSRSPWHVLLPAVRPVLRATVRGRCHVRAVRLQAALTLFQVENGRPARSLEELVPKYLAAVPLDPHTGQPFSYRVSKGERLPGPTTAGDPWETEAGPRVLPGQGILTCEGPEYFLVPLWRKR